MKYAISMWGVRAGIIEFNDNASGRELKHILKNKGFSIEPLSESIETSHSSEGGIGGMMVQKMIASYAKNLK